MGSFIPSATWYGANLERNCFGKWSTLPSLWCNGKLFVPEKVISLSFPVAYARWRFSWKNFFIRTTKCWVLTSENCKVSAFLLYPPVLITRDLIFEWAEQKAVITHVFCKLYFELCVLFVYDTQKNIRSRFIHQLSFIDPPAACQKNKKMNTNASEIVGKAGCDRPIKSGIGQKLLSQRSRRWKYSKQHFSKQKTLVIKNRTTWLLVETWKFEQTKSLMFKMCRDSLKTKKKHWSSMLYVLPTNKYWNQGKTNYTADRLFHAPARHFALPYNDRCKKQVKTTNVNK